MKNLHFTLDLATGTMEMEESEKKNISGGSTIYNYNIFKNTTEYTSRSRLKIFFILKIEIFLSSS